MVGSFLLSTGAARTHSGCCEPGKERKIPPDFHCEIRCPHRAPSSVRWRQKPLQSEEGAGRMPEHSWTLGRDSLWWSRVPIAPSPIQPGSLLAEYPGMLAMSAKRMKERNTKQEKEEVLKGPKAWRCEGFPFQPIAGVNYVHAGCWGWCSLTVGTQTTPSCLD